VASVPDATTAAVLHGREAAVFADAGYTGADNRPEHEDRDVSWNIAVKRSIIKALPKGLRDLAEPVERALSQVRAWVEHPFHVVKNPGLRRGRLCSAIRSCATAASSRTRRNCAPCSRWPTW
jgi:IS5 family transposase